MNRRIIGFKKFYSEYTVFRNGISKRAATWNKRISGWHNGWGYIHETSENPQIWICCSDGSRVSLSHLIGRKRTSKKQVSAFDSMINIYGEDFYYGWTLQEFIDDYLVYFEGKGGKKRD